MHTEDQAKELWCPLARLVVGHHETGRMSPPCNVTRVSNESQPALHPCIASDCAMWRWGLEVGTTEPSGITVGVQSKTQGFCGLAGAG